MFISLETKQKNVEVRPNRMLQKHLKPYRPNLNLTLSQLEVNESVLGTEDWEAEYGFKQGSMQHGFFFKPSQGRAKKIAIVLHSGDTTPVSMNSRNVIARLFGIQRGTEFEIWHLSVNKSHERNDSDAGKRWGLYGIRLDTSSSKSRWYDPDGRMVGKSNSESTIRGSPNPYAVQCLYLTIKALHTTMARQHESMPCAQLFDSQYDHKTHPATQLIYRTLGFERVSGLDAYSWNKDTMVDIDCSWDRFLFRMSMGIPSIFDGSVQRRPRDGAGGALARVCNCSFSD